MTTLREFGFNDLCDEQENLRNEIQSRINKYNFNKANMVFKQFKLWEFIKSW